MIIAAGIPVIDADMTALAAHARTLRAAGAGITDTGAQVHQSWQGLAPHYIAPEAGQLLAATASVQHVAAAVGQDVQAVGQILAGYAEQVRAIQARLDDLRAQASAFEHAVAGTDDWTTDQGLVDRNNHLLAAVHTAVADFDDAGRRCANAINALLGGPPYSTDDGDGIPEHGEYGRTPAQLHTAATSLHGVPWGRPTEHDDGDSWITDIGHAILDVAGLVPVLGEAADGINAGWYTAEGDYLNAGLSAAAAIPLFGYGATAAKVANKTLDATSAARATDDTGHIIGILRDSARYKGDFGLGSGTRAQADEAGNAWVGPNPPHSPATARRW